MDDHIESISLDMGSWTMAARLHLPSLMPGQGLAIVSHGLFANMSSIKHRKFCKLMTDRGWVAVRFDAQGCGRSTGSLAQTTLSDRVNAIQTLKTTLLAKDDISGPVILIGSSFGGTASLIMAAADRSVAGVIAMSAPVDFGHLVERWDTVKRAEMAPRFFEELASPVLPDDLGGLGPVLLIHANEDEVVPVIQAHQLFQRLDSRARLAILYGSDHALHAPQALERALGEASEWLDRIDSTEGGKDG